MGKTGLDAAFMNLGSHKTNPVNVLDHIHLAKVGIKVESKMSMLAGVDINPHRGNSYTREKGILAKKAMNEAWSDHVKSKCI